MRATFGIDRPGGIAKQIRGDAPKSLPASRIDRAKSPERPPLLAYARDWTLIIPCSGIPSPPFTARRYDRNGLTGVPLKVHAQDMPQ
jgi:hypothetical protein